MRYAWDLREQYLAESGLSTGVRGFAARTMLDALQRWDRARSADVDAFVTLSQYIGDRIQRAYGRSSTVIYPPVDVEFFTPGAGDRRARRLLRDGQSLRAVQACRHDCSRVRVASRSTPRDRRRRTRRRQSQRPRRTQRHARRTRRVATACARCCAAREPFCSPPKKISASRRSKRRRAEFPSSRTGAAARSRRFAARDNGAQTGVFFTEQTHGRHRSRRSRARGPADADLAVRLPRKCRAFQRRTVSSGVRCVC